MELERELLRSFGIEAKRIDQVTNRLFQVSDGSRRFALKKSPRLLENTPLWESIHEHAAYGRLKGVLPLYRTADERYALHWNETAYYVMPWIDSTSWDLACLYETIGNIHGRTVQIEQLDAQAWIRSLHTYRRSIDTMSSTLVRYIERFEKKHVLSPFELTFCTHFKDVEMALSLLKDKTDKLLAEMEEATSWKSHLVHGSINEGHFLNGSSPFLINWEEARRDHATADLLRFFQDEMRDSQNFANKELYTDLFEVYLQENELNEMEMDYLSIQLLSPAAYLDDVQANVYGRTQEAMINQIRILNSHYRLMMFGVFWTRHWDGWFAERKRRSASDPAQVKSEEQAD